MEPAAYFGDVVTQISRAVDDDEEDCQLDESLLPVLRWCPSIRQQLEASSTKCLKCSILMVAVGAEAVGFSQAYLLPEDPEILGVIASGMSSLDKNSFSQKADSDKTCFIHRLASNPEVLVVLCKSNVAPEQAFSWTQQLFENIESENLYVTVLSSSLVTEYKSSKLVSELSTPFIRALRSSAYKAKPQSPFLEAPNMVSSLPAAVLNHCQVNSIAAVLYVAFVDSPHVDVESMEVFKPVLEATPVKDLVQPRPGASKRLQQFVSVHLNTINLYT
ncbi:proteasome assembly chaperone 1-like [Anneissia japonica]|uniref:proteasome assembly chaperone 1-like n=1 Tax=Anneissia japonica TaxID=1529436 RepID=UPI001425A8F3|nr:proteasome assembly chaperone 1-like [Anneissia japonica]